MHREYLIVAMVPEPLASVITDLRQRYDRWSERPLPPHITIIRPLHSVPDRLLEQADRLDYPFTVTLQGWYGFRNPEQHVVWLDPGQGEPRRVAEMLYRGHPTLRQLDNGRYQPGRPHIFHVTVANHIPDADFPSVMARLRQHEVTGTAVIPKLTLLYRDLPDGSWQTGAPS